MTKTCIVPNLYQGSHPPPGRYLHDAGFRTLILCALEHQHRADDYPGLCIVRAPMDDTPHVPVAAARAAARHVVQSVRQGCPTYVACHMGLNRSGLVAALALRELTGWSGRECVLHIQLRRDGALSNDAFADYVSSLPAKGQRRGSPGLYL